MADFPADVSTGRIHGTVLQWLVDSADPGSVPDVAPFALATVKFVPSVSFVTHPATGTIFVPVPAPIEIDVNGDIDVTLIATDDPDINPSNFTYTMSITIVGASIAPMVIEVPSGSDRLLTELVSVETSPGAFFTQGPAGASAYQIAVNNGFPGTEAQWLSQWVTSDGSITNVVGLTQAAYDALAVKDPSTLYVITP
jgi:hypothetical protein